MLSKKFPKYPLRGLLSIALLLIIAAMPSFAWGPHTEITQAAIDVLDADDPLARHLGPYMERLPAYSWMPDYRGKLKTIDGTYYYPDDFLLYPSVPKHIVHVMPPVEEAFEPYFWRALQALRTETPLNAAAWIGSLIHFTEDPGAPPHALRTGGALHGPMENWVDKSKIHIEGYRPRLLGATDEEALAGYLARMQELVAFSIKRAEKIIPMINEENRPIVEPIILESALESAKATADLLYTIGRLDHSPRSGSAGIRGTIMTKFDPGSDNRPVKVVLLGTDYSTVADQDGFYEFRNLPPGNYSGRIIRPGCSLGIFQVNLRPGETRNLNIVLLNSRTPGNLFRNADFRLKWVRPDAPDAWFQVGEVWHSDIVPTQPGDQYVLNIDWKEGVEAVAEVRWFTSLVHKQGTQIDETQMKAGVGELILTAPEGATSAQVIIRTPEMLTDVCEEISLTPVKGK